MSTVHTDAKRQEMLLAFTKGAPDVLLARCTQEQVGEERRPLTPERRAAIRAANEGLAKEALRTLGVALRLLPKDTFTHDAVDEDLEHELVFLGLIGMIDPPRAEAAEAVRRAKAAGIRPLMITGDHPVTASVIAAELGIATDGRVITGAEIQSMSDDALEEAVEKTSVYARVNPDHKLRIVTALQRRGSIVAMTGDGVNDAPALRTADIGVAMGITGTDVSKEAADIVLADDNFASIVAAVEEGRAIFANIRKFLRYLLSSNIGEVLTMFFGIVLADVIGLVPPEAGAVALPLLATQVLWVNLVTDGPPALALGVDPADADVMRHRAAAIRRRRRDTRRCGRTSSSSEPSWRREPCSCSMRACRAASSREPAIFAMRRRWRSRRSCSSPCSLCSMPDPTSEVRSSGCSRMLGCGLPWRCPATASRRSPRPVPAAGVLDGCFEHSRLAHVRCRWELRPLVVREQEAAYRARCARGA